MTKQFWDAMFVMLFIAVDKTCKSIIKAAPLLFVVGMIALFSAIVYNTDDVKVGDVYTFKPVVEFKSDVQRNKETETVIQITELSLDGDRARYVFLTLRGKPYTLEDENTINLSFLDRMYEKRLSTTE